MNLDQITTKCWILALFIRDDGERMLLGDGWYDFKDSLQHFQPNTIASDIVELQGTDGQLLAGQVRRSASQSFDGYVGDAITSRAEIENRRRQFIQFFRVRRHYKVIYIFPDGTAIQRRMGYLTDAPSVPEMWQKFPEYHVALNFEDVNYYEYAEDTHGDEIYAHEAIVNLLKPGTGGLIWDAAGAVSLGYTWLDPQTVTGDYITVNDGATGSPLTLSQLTGNAEQTTYSGKNLLPMKNTTRTINDVTFTPQPDGSIKLSGTASAQISYPINVDSSSVARNVTIPAGSYIVDDGIEVANIYVQAVYQETGGSVTYKTGSFTTTAEAVLGAYIRVNSGANTNGTVVYPMLVAGTTAGDYEPYVGGTASPNPDYPQAIDVVTGEQTIGVTGKNLIEVADVSLTNQTINYYRNQSPAINTTLIAGQAYTFSCDMTIGGSVTNCVVSVGCGTTTYGHDIRITSGVTSGHFSVTFTPTENDLTYGDNFYFRLPYIAGITTGVNFSFSNVQLELGSTATTYEPYQGQSYTIDLDTLELAKIGTYQDRIYKDDSKWYIEKQAGKVVLDGTESWGGLYQNTAGLWTSNAPIPTEVTQGNDAGLSDHFVYKWLYNSTSPCFYVYNQGGQGRIMLIQSVASDSATFTTWLSNNKPIVYYALATPTTTEITDETLLSQLNFIASLYEGVNNISIVGTGAQGEMEVLIRDVLDVETDVVPETPVRLTLTDGGVINACGCRRDVELTMRETTE